LAQLCHELVSAGVLSGDAAVRVGEAIIADIKNTPAADWQTRNRLETAIRPIFQRIGSKDETHTGQ
ncbi:hypothetical protein NBU61_28300, partial [Escherichia coli]|uniref:hypothetical protein n=2 Tax=Pseudomonadota TaxID=1224 RepID=UPI002480279B